MAGESLVEELCAACEARGAAPLLVIMDTLARCMPGGDENTAKDANLVVATCEAIIRELKCTVLLVHHIPKDGHSTPRGSTVFPGAADTLMSLSGSAGKSELTCQKQKNGAEFFKMNLRLVETGDSVVSVVIDDKAAPEDRIALLRESESVALRALVKLTADQETAARHTEWLAAAELPKATFSRSLKTLVENRWVVKEGTGGYRPAASVIAMLV